MQTKLCVWSVVLAWLLPGSVRAAATEEDERALNTARVFLGAIRDRDVDSLAKHVAFPYFHVGVGSSEGADAPTCTKRTSAKEAQGFRALARCLVSDALFVKSIPPRLDGPEMEWKVIPVKKLPPDLKKHRKALTRLTGHRLVEAVVMGDGITYTVVAAVSQDRISAFLVASEFAE